MGSETTWNLAFQNRVSDDFGRARDALEALADPKLANPTYAEANLRTALIAIGQFHEPWMGCYPNDRQTLAAAERYIKRRPSFDTSNASLRRGLAACGSGSSAPRS